jgi:hypothetical protein
MPNLAHAVAMQRDPESLQAAPRRGALDPLSFDFDAWFQDAATATSRSHSFTSRSGISHPPPNAL